MADILVKLNGENFFEVKNCDCKKIPAYPHAVVRWGSGESSYFFVSIS
jgi:hypothetical protein